MRILVWIRLCLLPLACTSMISVQAAEDRAPSIAVAHIGDRAISLQELDAAGGRPLYDLAEQLYESRVRALYQLLSTELLNREANARGLTAQQLTDQEIVPKSAEVSDAEIDAFLKTQGSKVPNDARGRQQARVYLGMKRQSDAKRAFVTQLFQKYQVRVALTAPPPPPPETVLGPMDPVLGKPEAPVTIVAFSDYRCPYCRDLSQTLDQLLERHPDDVRVVYRNYPLHDDSAALAQAALCAADQGKFAPYHQNVFARNAGAKDVAAIAVDVGLDLPSFDACIKDERHRSRIDDDMKEGQRLGISGTPTLFVAGQRLRGAQSLERLTSAVQQALRAPTLAATPAAPTR